MGTFVASFGRIAKKHYQNSTFMEKGETLKVAEYQWFYFITLTQFSRPKKIVSAPIKCKNPDRVFSWVYLAWNVIYLTLTLWACRSISIRAKLSQSVEHGNFGCRIWKGKILCNKLMVKILAFWIHISFKQLKNFKPQENEKITPKPCASLPRAALIS